MKTIKSQNILSFLPFMWDSTLEYMTESMIKTELVQKLMGLPGKATDFPCTDSNHSEVDSNIPLKNKLDTDHSSSASKQQSLDNSPVKESEGQFKIQNLNMTTDKFSQVLWQFISERYAPYLELLNHCNISPQQFGPVIRVCLHKYFSELLTMEPVQLSKYWKDHKVDRLDMQVLIFGLKLISILSRGVTGESANWKASPKKELDKLKAVYQKINMCIQAKQVDQILTTDNSKYTNSLLGFYAMLPLDKDAQLRSEEFSKNENLPALKCARSILINSEDREVLDKELDKVAEKWSENVNKKRIRSSKEANIAQSQDPNDLIRSIRKKRSHANCVLGDVNLDSCGSPNVKSMGVITSLNNCDTDEKFNSFRYSSQQAPALSFGAKLTPSSNIRNVHKKQDKSKVQKYSPFMKREKSIQKKRKTYGSKKKVGSNSFLYNAVPQMTKMAIHKGRREDKKKSGVNLTGALGMISKASCEMAKNTLQILPEENEPSESVQLIQTQKSIATIFTKELNDTQEIVKEKDELMSNGESSKEWVLVYNTPSKADLLSQEVNNNEFDF